MIIASLVLANCGAKKTVVKSTSMENLPSVKQNPHVNKLKKNSSNLNKYTLYYIKKYAPLAVNQMHQHDIPASITLAQGILESSNGRSQLASKSNNHFGIKCHKGWKGKRVFHDDDKKQECFRKYLYVINSYNDHSVFLTTRKRYASLFKLKKTNYKGWAKGLKKAGYATDKKYSKKLIKIITDYKLYKFDKIRKKDLKRSRFTVKKVENITKKTALNYHEVKKGETLYSIAKKNNITVESLKKINKLRDNTISVGQRLLLR